MSPRVLAASHGFQLRELDVDADALELAHDERRDVDEGRQRTRLHLELERRAVGESGLGEEPARLRLFLARRAAPGKRAQILVDEAPHAVWLGQQRAAADRAALVE